MRRLLPDGGSGSGGRDRGSIMPLIFGFAAVATLLVTGATAASSAFLAQRDLSGVCDGAALAAAQSIDLPAVYQSAGSARLPLSQGGVEQSLADYAARNYAADSGGLTLAGSTDGQTVEVRCNRTVVIPFGRFFGFGAGLPRSASAHARSPLGTGH